MAQLDLFASAAPAPARSADMVALRAMRDAPSIFDAEPTSPTPTGDANAKRLTLAHDLAAWCDENRLTLAGRTLRQAIRGERVARTLTEQDDAKRELVAAIEYARDELAGMRDELEDQDDHEAERLAAMIAWQTDPAAWLLSLPTFGRHAEAMAAETDPARGVDHVHYLATQTAGGGGPGYAYQCDGGGITVAEHYADLTDQAADRRRVTWVGLARRARQDATALF